MRARVVRGLVEEVLPRLPPESFSACLCDPPYALEFMGKDWDRAIPGPAIWREVLRVLKPGAHLLAFGGTRTFHRLACSIEDAGFEVRDCMMWLYGTGFPKSLDVSKAIDKLDAAEERLARRYRFTGWIVENCSLTAREMDEVCSTNTMGRHWTDRPPGGKQPDIATREHFEKLRPYFTSLAPDWIEALVDERTVESENFKRRKVVGAKISGIGNASNNHYTVGGTKAERVDITAPATPEASAWQGYGTALKPAWEPVILAMKPCDGTFAANALAHGVAGLNIDGCRGAVDERPLRVETGRTWESSNMNSCESRAVGSTTLGRWPANVILDDSVGRELDARVGASKSDGGTRHAGKFSTGMYSPGWSGSNPGSSAGGFGDVGGPSRFFYCAKASKRERGEGNAHPTVKPLALTEYLARLLLPPPDPGDDRRLLVPFAGSGSEVIGGLQAGWDKVVGIERDPEYVQIARGRIADRGLDLDLPPDQLARVRRLFDQGATVDQLAAAVRVPADLLARVLG